MFVPSYEQAVRVSRVAQSVLSNFYYRKIKCWEQCETLRAECDVHGVVLDLLKETLHQTCEHHWMPDKKH